MLSRGWLGHVAELWLNGDERDLSEGFPRQHCRVERIEAQHQLHATRRKTRVVVVVVLGIQLDGQQVRKLLDGGFGDAGVLESIGVQDQMNIAAQSKAQP